MRFPTLPLRLLRSLRSLSLLLLAAVSPCRAHWVPVAQPTSAPLNDVLVLPDGNGWVAGDQGAVYATNNAGESWWRQTTPLNNRLLHIEFASPMVGWISGEGAGVAHTTDGGSRWEKVTVTTDDLGIGPPDSIDPIIATDETHAWALARWGSLSFLYHTTDGGDSWSRVPYTRHGYFEPNTVYAIDFPTETEGWLLASRISTTASNEYTPVFVHTTDGGATWQTLDAPPSPVNSPTDPTWRVLLDAVDTSEVFLHIWDTTRQVGERFWLLKTDLSTWGQDAQPMDVPLNSVSLPQASTAWLVGTETYQSVDRLQTYRRTANPEGLSLTARFTDADNGWAVSPDGRIFRWVPDPTGDVNGDGATDITDAVWVYRMAMGEGPNDALSIRLADVAPPPRGDRRITLTDVAGILRLIAGLSVRVQPQLVR